MENKNGRGIFLGVVSVATLVVAIIGATFAFFSAGVTSNAGDIGGNTLDISDVGLSLDVHKVNLGGSATYGDDLVPAVFTNENAAEFNAALTKHCVDDGGDYTGCHLYEIVATSASAVSSADILLSMTTTASVNTNWKYAVYTGTSASVGTVKNVATIASTSTPYNMNANLGLPAGGTTYYLLVYLKNIDASQNPGDATDETGTYSGTVTLNAAGGQVKATFTAS